MVKDADLALLPENPSTLVDSGGPLKESRFQAEFGLLSITVDNSKISPSTVSHL